MNLHEFVTTIALLKPSGDEIIESFKGKADSEYVDYIQDCFVVSLNEDCETKNLIEQIIKCTNAGKVDFGGISFNYTVESIHIQNTPYLKFASFQENILAASIDFATFIYADLYDPNGELIQCRAPLQQDKFISAMLALLKLDVEFKYKNKPVLKSDILKLTEIAGDRLYIPFFESIYSQFI